MDLGLGRIRASHDRAKEDRGTAVTRGVTRRNVWPHSFRQWSLRPATIVAWCALLTTAAGAGAQQPEQCGDRALLHVRVADQSGTVLLPGAIVVVRWTDLVERPVRDATGEDGHYFLCVPENVEGATLWAEFGDHSSRQTVAIFEGSAVHEVVLRILTEGIQSGRLMGQIRDVLTEAPVATAAVSVRGRPLVVDTNRQGRFVLTGVPAGEHEVEVRRIGYAPLRHSITVDRGLTTEVEIALVPTPVEMEPIVAAVTRVRRLEIVGFYERKHWGELTGLGHFITADEIDRWRPLSVSGFVSMMVPGMSGLANRRMSMGFSNQPCPMKQYIDGVLLRSGGMDQYIRPFEIGAIEVYKGPASLPAEFTGSDARCGAVLVWTR